MRVPSTGCCCGKSFAYFVPGLMRPTSYFCSSSKVSSLMAGPGLSSHWPSGPRVMSGLRRRSWWTTTTPSFVIAMSHSIVSTPRSSAFWKAGSVFSGSEAAGAAVALEIEGVGGEGEQKGGDERRSLE